MIRVNCNECGAPLEVTDETQFATCACCGAQLEIHHSESATFTKLVRKLDWQSDLIQRRVAEIEKRHELATLDYEWMARWGEWSRLSDPLATSELVLLAGLFIVFGCAISVVRVSPLVGILLLVKGTLVGFAVYSVRSKQLRLRQDFMLYQRRRDEILYELEVIWEGPNALYREARSGATSAATR